MLRSSLTCLLLLSVSAPADEPSDADKRIVQTVQRLASFDYSKASQKTKEAIDRYLTATAGSEEYFQLVEKYAVTGQKDTLLALATGKGGTPLAGQAVKMLFQLGQGTAVKEKLAALDPAVAAVFLEDISSVGSKETVELAAGVLTDAKAPLPSCLAAIKGLGRNTAGQQAILAAVQAGKLPEGAKSAAATVLSTSTDEGIRAAAAKALPAVEAAKPVIADLMKKPGDAVKGQTVYMTYCFVCHQVNGQGVDFGPALSEIGSKLPKEAIFDAVLNPSAGISAGFEGWDVKMKDGNNFLGIVASETDAELSLKVPGGIIQKCAKSAIASRDKLKVSLMTPNLYTVMSKDDLVNLVEYMASLKKKP
ncbi:MAG TPA: c-type cytochrome [Verrucomicrobiales bacterium]|nr:c-type cytochrome [Verrucomicrobiales bacterium]